MDEMTLEQKRALALARARLRAQRPAEKAPDPTEGMSGTEKALAGAGKAISDTGLGLRQLASYVGIGDRGALEQEARERQKRDQALMETGAGMAGNIGGNIAMTLLPGGALKAAGGLAQAPGLTAAGSALLAPKTIKGAAALGAGFGAVQPAEDLGGRAAMAGIGGVAGAAVPAAMAAYRTSRAVAEPLYESGQQSILGRLLRRTAGDEADTAMRAMQGAQELVPGSQPTAGQVAGSGGIAALERAAAQANPEAYAQRGLEQNAARLAAVRSVAGDEGQLAAAEGARSRAAGELYEQAYEAGTDLSRFEAGPQNLTRVNDRLNKLLERPALQNALKEAQRLAANEGVNLETPAGSIKGLDYVKRALDDQIGLVEGNEKRILVSLKEDLLRNIDELSPKYAEARQTFQAMSRPINQMKIGQALLNKVEPALSQGGTPIRMNAETYARALRGGDVTAQRATEFPGATLKGTMEPAQLQTLEAVRQDLARSATAANLGRGAGSNTFQNLAQENLMQQAGVSSLPQMFSAPVQIANYGLRAVYGSANEDMKRKLAQALLNPQEAAQLMQRATPSEKQLLIELLTRRTLTPAALSVPGLVNANQ